MNASSARIRRRLKTVIFYLLVVFLIFLAMTGRLSWIFAFVASLLPLLKRLPLLLRYSPMLHQLYQRYQGRAKSAQTSTVKARFLDLTLNHDTGDINGIIREGEHKGQTLSQLSIEELIECWQLWKTSDIASARLLTAYLDRKPGNNTWQSTVNDSGTMHDEVTKMTEVEALAILGLTKPIDRQIIIQTHRRLIQKLHPDRGGSNYLAAKINQAKDYLLNQYVNEPDSSI